MTDMKLQVQEAQKTPSRINTLKSTSQHIIFQLKKTKQGEILKETKGENSPKL
jgi:hypothetical protein